MDSLTDSARNLLDTVARWLPQFLGALLLLLIGYLVAKALERITWKVLSKLKFDDLLHRGTAGSYIERVVPKPSALLGSVVFWLVWLGTLSIAVTVLGVPALTAFVYAVYAYVPNIVAAIVIFLVAGAVAGGAAALVTRLMGDTATGKVVATGVPVVTMLIATFMIINQLQIAPAIVTITYAAIMGAVALGMALAFGLGGREVAAKLLDQAYAAGQRQSGQVKQDLEAGKRHAMNEVHERTRNNPLEG